MTFPVESFKQETVGSSQAFLGAQAALQVSQVTQFLLVVGAATQIPRLASQTGIWHLQVRSRETPQFEQSRVSLQRGEFGGQSAEFIIFV
jgi:hypothetical protein